MKMKIFQAASPSNIPETPKGGLEPANVTFLELEQEPEMPVESDSRSLRVLNRGSLLLALLQSICTAVLTLSGIRVAIGLSALAAASGVYEPATGYHRDAIRIPMLVLAVAGALLNLGVLFWIWHLRSRPSAQWRRRELTSKEKRSERIQVVLAVVTLVLVGLETWTHTVVFRHGPPPNQIDSPLQ